MHSLASQQQQHPYRPDQYPHPYQHYHTSQIQCQSTTTSPTPSPALPPSLSTDIELSAAAADLDADLEQGTRTARSDSPAFFPHLRPIPSDLYPCDLSPSYQQQKQQPNNTYHSASSPACPCPDCSLIPPPSSSNPTNSCSSKNSSFIATAAYTSSSSPSTAIVSTLDSLDHGSVHMNPVAFSPVLSAKSGAIAIPIPPPSQGEYGSSNGSYHHHHGSFPSSASMASSWSQTITAHHYPHQQPQHPHHQDQRSYSAAHQQQQQQYHQQDHHQQNHRLSLSALPASDPSSVMSSAVPEPTVAALPPALVINTSFLHQPSYTTSNSHHSYQQQHLGSSAPSSAGARMPQQQQHYQQQQPESSARIPISGRAKIPVHHHHPTTLAQLADFAAHMVCHLLFGHQAGTGSPLSPIPISPRPTTSCSCSSCLQQQMESPITADGMLPSPVSARPSHSSYYDHATCANRSPPTPRSAMSGQQSTHRRMYSESMDSIPSPTPLFRKFCLDVLSATQLSRSVILLSLKYIEKLMIHLKISNKIVNTGEGAEYRFFTGALILANKFLDDNTFTNKTWAEITGMKMVDVNHLEMQFLNGIDFRLFTSPEEYQEWLNTLTHFATKHLPALSMVPSHSQPLPAHQHPHPAYQQQPPPLPSQQPPQSHQNHAAYHGQHHQAQLRTPISPDEWNQRHHSHSGGRHGAVQDNSSMYESGRQGYAEYPPQQIPVSGTTSTSTVTNRSSQRLSSSYSSGYERHAAGKRSAYQAFDDPMEDPMLSSSSSSALPSHGPTHKRASLSLSAGMSLLDVGSHQNQHTQSLRTLHERSSHGSLRRSYKTGGLSSHPYHPHSTSSTMDAHVLPSQLTPQHYAAPHQQPQPHLSGPSSSSRRSHARTLSDSSSFGSHGGHYQHEVHLAPPAHIPAPVGAVAGPVASLTRSEHQSSSNSSNRSSWAPSSSSSRPVSMQSVGGEVHIAVPSSHHSHSQSFHQHHHHAAPVAQPPPQPVYEVCSCQSTPIARHPQDIGCGCLEASGHHRQLSAVGTPTSSAVTAATVVPSHPFYPTPPPFAPSDKYGHATASVVMGEPIETRVAMPSSAGGPSSYSPHHLPHPSHPHHHNQFEFDPRMWAPFDSLSLYAITSQAAKRVVAHSKVLSASASNLHMYYPTSLA